MQRANRGGLWVTLAALATVVGPGALLSACPDSGSGSGPACTPAAGQCPNFCEHGIGVKGESCAGPTDCGCGLFCKASVCSPYEGANTGCSCAAVTPPADTQTGTTDAGGGADTSGPNIDDCDKAAPAGASCNPYCNLGCEVGKQCTFEVSAASFGCRTVGDKTIGAACSSSAECGLAMACFGLTADPTDVCREFCITDADCPEGRQCTMNVTFPGDTSATFCGDPAVGCDPFDAPATACASGSGCYFAQGSTKCMAAGALAVGENCQMTPNACAPGLQCLAVCQEICSLDGSAEPKCSACPSGVSMPISAENDMGICLTDTIPAQCDLFAQTGCGAGTGCYSVQGGHGCVQAGDIEVGAECEYSNSCVPGLICVNNVCAPPCSERPDAPAEVACATKCQSFNGLQPEIWQIGFCTDIEAAEPCSFWAQDCAGGKVCYPTIVGETCLTPGVSGAEGAECSSHTDCALGLVCKQGTGVCTAPCSIDEFVAGAPICLDACPGGFSPIAMKSLIGTCD